MLLGLDEVALVQLLLLVVRHREVLVVLVSDALVVVDSFAQVLRLLFEGLDLAVEHGALELLLDETEPALDHEALDVLVVGQAHQRALHVEPLVLGQEHVHLATDEVLARELAASEGTGLVSYGAVDFGELDLDGLVALGAHSVDVALDDLLDHRHQVVLGVDQAQNLEGLGKNALVRNLGLLLQPPVLAEELGWNQVDVLESDGCPALCQHLPLELWREHGLDLVALLGEVELAGDQPDCECCAVSEQSVEAALVDELEIVVQVA